MTTTYKSHIGKEDFSVQTNINTAETFTRKTSTGGVITMTKMPDIWEGKGCVKVNKILVCAADSPSTILHAFGGIS